MSSLRAQKPRRPFLEKMKNLWVDFRGNKIGLVGISVVIAFVLMAAFASQLTPYDPIVDKGLAEEIAMPQWITIFPQFADLPPTMNLPINWTLEREEPEVSVERSELFTVHFRGTELKTTETYLYMNFSYPYSPPRTFTVHFRWGLKEVVDVECGLELLLITPNSSYSLWDASSSREASSLKNVEVISTTLNRRLDMATEENVAHNLFSDKGNYSLLMHLLFTPKPSMENQTSCELVWDDQELSILGLVHGILGTDKMGADVFSQLVYGSRASLLVGLSAALLLTVVGLLVGVVSGYMGGFVDEVTMRVVDLTLCLPWLPLLLTLVFVFGKSLLNIIILLGILEWQSLARIVRSQVLSLREMTFIDASKIAGGSKRYIIVRHIIPNVLPTAFAAMILSIPTAIVTEATLSFLGFGDPRIITWGKMLQNAFQWGAFSRLAWWWLLPPGIALAALSLGFAFIGHAIDEIVNPRLRKRR
jgi:ABC-type dipeptide/oligopeptide/nickel transport system permease subunit